MKAEQQRQEQLSLEKNSLANEYKELREQIKRLKVERNLLLELLMKENHSEVSQ
jgi:predicted nuclease with TOPRIM domain